MDKCKEKIFYENLNLVDSVINCFKGHELGINTLDDLYQVGCIGLMKAVECGDPNAPYFKTYMRTSVWNAMLREIESKKKFSTIEILSCSQYDDNGDDVTTGIPPEALTKIVPNSASLDYSVLVEYLTERAKTAETSVRIRVQKGVKYLILREVYGYNLSEITKMCNEKKIKCVSAYISVAKKYFRQDSEFNRIFA